MPRFPPSFFWSRINTTFLSGHWLAQRSLKPKNGPRFDTLSKRTILLIVPTMPSRKTETSILPQISLPVMKRNRLGSPMRTKTASTYVLMRTVLAMVRNAGLECNTMTISQMTTRTSSKMAMAARRMTYIRTSKCRIGSTPLNFEHLTYIS